MVGAAGSRMMAGTWRSDGGEGWSGMAEGRSETEGGEDEIERGLLRQLSANNGMFVRGSVLACVGRL